MPFIDFNPQFKFLKPELQRATMGSWDTAEESIWSEETYEAVFGKGTYPLKNQITMWECIGGGPLNETFVSDLDTGVIGTPRAICAVDPGSEIYFKPSDPTILPILRPKMYYYLFDPRLEKFVLEEDERVLRKAEERAYQYAIH